MAITSLHYRAARKDEARIIAQLYRLSSAGVADYIWTQLARPGESLLDVGDRRYARENTDFSYQNVTVVESDGAIVGMMAGYVVGPKSGDEFDFDVDPVLLPYAKLEQPNSFYISGMAVFPRFRGQGHGSQLLRIAEDKASTSGLRQVSLIVFEENQAAKRLYERVGFHEVMRYPVVPHPLIQHGGDALLLVKEILR